MRRRVSDELHELANSDSTHRWLIELRCEVPQTQFIERREAVKAPNRNGGIEMKRTMTLVLAASILTLTMAATPHCAMAASDSYLTIDGIGEPSPSPQPPHQTTFWEGICAVFGF
jgi:hypothetical protein